MRRFLSNSAMLAALVGIGVGNSFAQNGKEEDGSRPASSAGRDTATESRRPDSNTGTTSNEVNRKSRSSSERDADGRLEDPEVRLRYNDERDRLEIDVDDEVKFRDRNDQRAWTKDGEFDLRYDRDRNTLGGSGEGTVRLDRVGSDMARWWQSWWEEEKRARRSRAEGGEQGAQAFIRRHDRNNDDYLSRSEVPREDRAEFAAADSNDDGHLSRTEVRRYGERLYDQPARSTSTATASRTTQSTSNSQNYNDDDQTWSEWWASWWSSDEAESDRERGGQTGAQRFVRQHDDNDDGYISRVEMPPRMRDDFADIDRNDDSYLSLHEIRQRGSSLYAQRSETTDRDYANNSQDAQTWSEWWSSWWSSDEAGNDRERGGQSGARQFVRQHDDNDDSHISRQEMPARMRNDFAEIDRNDDGYLSAGEIEQQGSSFYAERATRDREVSNRTTTRSHQNDPTWSEWWASWWSDNNAQNGGSRDRERIAEQGAREFIRRHDDNDDGYLVRSEMPRSMYDEFSRIDRNDDRYLTLSEIREHAGPTRSQDTTGSSRSLDSQSPGYVAYVLIVNPAQSEWQLRELQHAYRLLRNLDANSDGNISSSELNQRREQAVTQWSEHSFQEMDENSNRILTRGEARGSVLGSQFDQFDRNGDDQLTMDEVQESVMEEFDGQTSRSRDAGSDNRR